MRMYTCFFLYCRQWCHTLYLAKTANRFEISSLLEKILLKQVRWCLTFVGLYIDSPSVADGLRYFSTTCETGYWSIFIYVYMTGCVKCHVYFSTFVFANESWFYLNPEVVCHPSMAKTTAMHANSLPPFWYG
jgi:hypothetical protein